MYTVEPPLTLYTPSFLPKDLVNSSVGSKGLKETQNKDNIRLSMFDKEH